MATAGAGRTAVGSGCSPGTPVIPSSRRVISASRLENPVSRLGFSVSRRVVPGAAVVRAAGFPDVRTDGDKKNRRRFFWNRRLVSQSERGDSNARPLRPERSALPTALLSEVRCKSTTIFGDTKTLGDFFSYFAVFTSSMAFGLTGSLVMSRMRSRDFERRRCFATTEMRSRVLSPGSSLLLASDTLRLGW